MQLLIINGVLLFSVQCVIPRSSLFQDQYLLVAGQISKQTDFSGTESSIIHNYMKGELRFVRECKTLICQGGGSGDYACWHQDAIPRLLLNYSQG